MKSLTCDTPVALHSHIARDSKRKQVTSILWEQTVWHGSWSDVACVNRNGRQKQTAQQKQIVEENINSTHTHIFTQTHCSQAMVYWSLHLSKTQLKPPTQDINNTNCQQWHLSRMEMDLAARGQSILEADVLKARKRDMFQDLSNFHSSD